jgi:hypothetical protein
MTPTTVAIVVIGPDNWDLDFDRQIPPNPVHAPNPAISPIHERKMSD